MLPSPDKTPKEDWTPEEIAEARQALLRDSSSQNIGFLPGSVEDKFRPADHLMRNARIARNTAAGITSFAVRPMRPLQFKARGPA
jgi:hypothetical protein